VLVQFSRLRDLGCGLWNLSHFCLALRPALARVSLAPPQRILEPFWTVRLCELNHRRTTLSALGFRPTTLESSYLPQTTQYSCFWIPDQVVRVLTAHSTVVSRLSTYQSLYNLWRGLTFLSPIKHLRSRAFRYRLSSCLLSAARSPWFSSSSAKLVLRRDPCR